MIFPVKIEINMHLQLALALRAWASLKNFTRNALFQIALEIIRLPILNVAINLSPNGVAIQVA